MVRPPVSFIGEVLLLAATRNCSVDGVRNWRHVKLNLD